MGYKAYRFVGLSRDVWLPDDIPVSIRIVDHPNVTNNVFSNAQTTTTWHDTGNDKTNAEGEYKWLAGGRQGGEPGGYNFIFDDKQIIQTGRLDQVTWHAGTAEGNRTSWGIEQAWGTGVIWQRSLEVGAALHGALCAAMGWNVRERLVQHNIWYGKDCPGQIRRRGLWPQVVEMTVQAAAKSRAAASGTQPTPQPGPIYAPPDVPAFLTGAIPATDQKVGGATAYRCFRSYTVKRETPVLKWADRGSPPLRAALKAGESFTGEFVLFSDGEWWALSKWGSRIPLRDCDVRIEIKAA